MLGEYYAKISYLFRMQVDANQNAARLNCLGLNDNASWF